MERVVRLATAGSVDDGKSTLIGRLLVETGSLYDDQISEIDAASARTGRQGRDLAFATDGLREERERNVTIDVAYRPLRTDKRLFLLADAPGHAEYTRNMVTAASTADLLIVLVDAARGIAPQTRRHLSIAAFLRIPVVLAVNKMDLVGYDQETFKALVAELTDLGGRLGCVEVRAVPISAFVGDNVVEISPSMPWYEGPSLLNLLESFPLPKPSEGPPRLPVQNVSSFEGGTVVTGTLLGSTIRVGDRLGAITVDRLWVAGEERTVAEAGQPVSLSFGDETKVSRGDWLGDFGHSHPPSGRFVASLFWMHSDPMRLDMTYRLRQGPRVLNASVRRIKGLLDLEDGELHPSVTVAMNDLAEVEIELYESASFALYRQDRDLGSFVLIDPSGRTVAAGTVDRILPNPRSVPPVARVFWLTGLSGAGKSSIAEATVARIREAGGDVVHLDGDSLRAGLCSDLGFSSEDRMENVRRTAEVAKLMVAHGRPTLCSLISPLREHRERARRILGDAYVEVFVQCELDECVRRDPKGLYARALEGTTPRFTGIGSPYEPPEDPDLILDTQALDLDSCVARLIACVWEGANV